MMGKTMLIVLSLTAISFFPGCEKKGTMEKAGEQIDKGIDKIQEKTEEAAEDVRESVTE
ncbi:MAG: hypothetical protein JW863_09945 [Chitinispirillaceae bacterium]|nr:hypothetical protein [Chitinispirillaceae bacterium]